MAEIFFLVLDSVFSATQVLLAELAKFLGVVTACYIFTAGMSARRSRSRLEFKVGIGFALVITLACLLNLSLFPILGFAAFFLFGCLIGLYLAFLDRPIIVPRD